MARKRIFVVWATTLLMLLAWGGVAIYRSGCDGKVVFRQSAEEELAHIAELEINRKFNALGIPYSVDPVPGGDSSWTTRVLITEKGTLKVDIDSLKESQSLYSLGKLGGMAFMLEAFSAFPLASLQAGLEEALGGDVPSLLVLSVTSPMTDSIRVERAGDLFVERADCLVGTYYLDDVYTMQLAAYARIGFWSSVEWRSPAVAVPLAGCLLACLAFIGWRLRARVRGRRPVGPVVSAVGSTWELGNLVYHKDNMVLTCNGQRVDIAPQSLKLFCAFLAHGGSLSDEDIVQALAWSLSDGNLNVKKRQAVSTLRGCLGKLDGRICIARTENGYKMFLK